MEFRGIDLTHPVNRIPAGRVSIAQNVRNYLRGGLSFRNLLTAAIFTLADAVHTIARLNDSTPNGPISGYTLINGAGTVLYNNGTSIATGMSGNPLSIVPFRPNTSVQPWAYVGDSSQSVEISTTSLFSGEAVTFPCTGMVKVRSDGVIYKSGVKEPQSAPAVGTENTSVGHSGNLLATAIPWTNYAGANPDFNYGETEGFPNVIPPVDGTAPFVVNCLNASTITIAAITGTATVNGNAAATPTTAGPSTSVSTNPGHYIQISGTGARPATATIITGAFVDASGNVMPVGIAPLFIPSIVDVGAVIGTPDSIIVPTGAQSFQIGINSTGNTFNSNSGHFLLDVVVTTNALPSNLGVIGPLALFYWNDSPTSGPVAAYIWKNPGDPGGGISRSTSNAIGNTSGNSFIFDTSFGSSAVPPLPPGIPGLPGIGSGDNGMQWFQISPNEAVTGSFSANPTQNQNFNFVLYGRIYIPAPGNYTFVLTYKDDVIWGIEGATLVSSTATQLSTQGQTITVVNGYPLLPRQTESTGEGGGYGTVTTVLSFAAAGIYGIELDYDFWYHSGRILLLMGSPMPGAEPTIIPPVAGNVRENVQYRYVYRSSATGATSNPSPESAEITIPVTSNTVTSLWSNDPQVDVVDYYRLDAATSSFTYVATGPNDNAGVGTNTPITDSLLDTELSNQLLNFDNFEPFPSIDLPQKGTCSVAGGVITWVSGGAIGGSSTGFNTRWLAGTEILIGSPTSLAYTFIARPTSTTSVTIPGVPDGTDLAYEIEEPVLAAQPLPYLFGPTDNINFTYGVGDPLRPGTLYWCAGSNLDAAPDTNQLDVTDPSEPLVNGAMSGGRGVLFSIKRAWVIMPNFFNATATATGTTGSTWTLQATSINRGLYIPRCIAIEGGGTIFFRVDDGIHASSGGQGSQSITDEDLYPLFPHENQDSGTSIPQPIVREGVTIYPPDDSQPNKQKFSVQNGYLYYDYYGTDGNPHTLVYDIGAQGWVWDIYQWPATVHAPNEGLSQQGTLVGCVDGSIRQMASAGIESGVAVVLTPAIGGKGWCHLREIVVEYISGAPITLTCIPADSGNGSYGPPAITIPSSGGTLTKYKISDGPGPNKWKLMYLKFESAGLFQLMIDGFVVYVRAWGTDAEYAPISPFGGNGGGG